MGKHLLDSLSERQCQLLELVGQDLTASKALAVDTGLSPGTIDNLLQNAAKTLEVRGRVAAAQRYRELSTQSHEVAHVRESFAATEPPAIPAGADPLPLLSPNTASLPPANPKRRRSLMRSVMMIGGVMLVLAVTLALLFQVVVATLGYPSCKVARLVGAAPIPKDKPGYRLALDRDRDGLACE